MDPPTDLEFDFSNGDIGEKLENIDGNKEESFIKANSRKSSSLMNTSFENLI